METDFTTMNTLVFKNGEKITITPAVVITCSNEYDSGLASQYVEDFKFPRVLYFAKPWLQHLVNFNFALEIILVNENGVVNQAFRQQMNSSNGSYIRGFSSLKMVLLCPENFIEENGIERNNTFVELTTYEDYVFDYLDEPWMKEISEMTVDELKGRIEYCEISDQSDFAVRRYLLLLQVELEKKDKTKKEVVLKFIEDERMEIYFETLIIRVESINRLFGKLNDFAFECQINGYTNGKLFCVADMNMGSAYLEELVEECLKPLGMIEYLDFAIAQEQKPPSSTNCFGPGIATYWHEEHPHLHGVNWLGSIIDENGNWIWYLNSNEN